MLRMCKELMLRKKLWYSLKFLTYLNTFCSNTFFHFFMKPCEAMVHSFTFNMIHVNSWGVHVKFSRPSCIPCKVSVTSLWRPDPVTSPYVISNKVTSYCVTSKLTVVATKSILIRRQMTPPKSQWSYPFFFFVHMTTM